MLKKVCAVLYASRQAAAVFKKVNPYFGDHCRADDAQLFLLISSTFFFRFLRFLFGCRRIGEKLELNLNQRGVAEASLRPKLLDQFLKRQILMRVCAQANLLDALQQFTKLWVAGQTGAQHQRIRKKAY